MNIGERCIAHCDAHLALLCGMEFYHKAHKAHKAHKGGDSISNEQINDIYVAYFYNNINKNTGTLKGLANTTYTTQWYNPINGQYQPTTTVAITNGTYEIGNKPDNNDWVLLVKIIK